MRKKDLEILIALHNGRVKDLEEEIFRSRILTEFYVDCLNKNNSAYNILWTLSGKLSSYTQSDINAAWPIAEKYIQEVSYNWAAYKYYWTVSL